MFKPQELQSSLLPSQHSKKYLKGELDQERFNLLNGTTVKQLIFSFLQKYFSVFLFLDAVRTRYRISKHHYTSFYKDRIQDTLANCLYNEGTRRNRRQPTGQEKDQQEPQQKNVQQQSQMGTNIFTNENQSQ